ncbi:MAG: pentapeptide repeat-containing protein [Cellvibrionaceae bacterium]|nr:pentapeptide repeat-containing protein [Cellvibrionaceae bacterium]
MQVIKPRRLGLIYKSYYWRHHHFAVGAVGFFPLLRPKAQQNHFLEEFDQWQKCVTQLPDGVALDGGFAKPRAEVLAVAKAYAHPQGILYHSQPQLEIASINKKVTISRLNNAVMPELLPVDMMAKAKKPYHGSYDKHWVETVHPGFPDDTNPLLFNSANQDQQLVSGKGKHAYFTPGLAYSLSDMHPDNKRLAGCLPNNRVRIFITIDDAQQGALFKEVPNVLETVWFFPEINLAAAIYRGVSPVNDSDALDVSNLLLAYEHAQDQARDIDYYRHVLSLRTDKKTALGHLCNESQLMPIKTQQEIDNLQALIQREAREKQHRSQQLRQTYSDQARESITAAMPAGSPGNTEAMHALNNYQTKSEAEDDAFAIPEIPEALLRSGDFDLSPMLEATEKLQQKLQQDFEKTQAELMATAAVEKEKYSPESLSTSKATSAETTAEATSLEAIKQRLLNPIYVQAEDLREQQAAQDNGFSTVVEAMPSVVKNALYEDKNFNPETLSAAYDKLLIMQRQARQSSPTAMQKYAFSDAYQRQSRDWVVELIEANAGLAGRDFSGINLSGINFSGMDLRDAMFEACNLSQCDFHHARMDGAVFTEAVVDNSCFDHAQLSKANFSHSHIHKTRFNCAQLAGSLWLNAEVCDSDFEQIQADELMATEASFTACCFYQAVINNGHFIGADFSHSRLLEASFTGCSFLKAVLTQSDWQAAQLKRCIMIEIEAEKLRFHRSVLEKVQFSNSGNLQAADFSYGRFTTCGFRGVNLCQLQADYAVFVECDFADAQLHQAKLSAALFHRSLMTKAQCQASDCERALFSENTLRKVNFDHCDLQDAAFYQCTLAENSFQHCNTRRLSVTPQEALR